MLRNSSSKILMLTAMIVLPVFCLALALAGTFIGYSVTSVAATAGNLDTIPVIDTDITEAEVLAIAADYATTGDLSAALARLDALNLPNTNQYISFMVDRYIQEDHAETDTQNLYQLARALGVGTTSMALALASPTPLPTATLPPTNTLTPEPTATLTPTPPLPTEEPTSIPEPTEEPTATPVPATETPLPPTPVPAEPTAIPEPTATPEPPKPAVDYVVAEAYLVPNPTYNTCPGAHQIFVTIIDAGGNVIDGVTVEDTFRAVPPKTSGEKGPGKLEYDLWNNGFALEVTKKADGAPATSEQTPKLSSWDEDIPNEWLVQANYCKDLAECVTRKGSNQLCRGHYSYNVTFKRTY